MSLDPPTYLSSLQNNIRARPIPWDGAVRTGTIADQDLKRIKAVDKVRKEQRRKTVEENYGAYRDMFLGGGKNKSILESAAKRPDVIQYILVLAGDLLNDVPNFPAELLKHADPYRPFLPFLTYSNNPEEPIPLLTSSVLSRLLAAAQNQSTRSNSQLDQALPKLFAYLAHLTKSEDSGLQDIAVQGYAAVLRIKPARDAFWDMRQETLAPLFDILRTAVGASRDADSTLWSGATSIRAGEGAIAGGVGIQLLYHVLLVVWLLSFEGATLGQDLVSEQEIIPLYVQLLRVSPKEKTTRLLLSTLRNLCLPNRDALLPVAVTARLPALLDNLRGRHLTDPDLLEDLTGLAELLAEHTSAQTTFDEYAAEVRAGHLRWSPPHRSATFWAENARRVLDADRSELPRKLAEIMGKEWEGDKAVLAIACNDVGWLVKNVPERRELMEKLGIKARLMELMGEADETVRWESLKAVGEWLRYSFEG